MELLKEIGAFAGLIAFFGLALLALLSFTQGRDIRRLREWAGSAPERDMERKESTSAAAAERAEELRRLERGRDAEREATELREKRRSRRQAGLPELTRSERLREGFSGLGERLGEPRYLVAIFVIALVVGGGIAYAVLHGFGSEEEGKGRRQAATKVKRSEIEVTVLNGTAVPGLAQLYGDKVEQQGFQLGAVTNSPSSFETSVVMYRVGSAPEAHRVARTLGLSKVKSMTSDISSVSAGAPVSVVIGEDNASSTG
jgi:hypothetical protein